MAYKNGFRSKDACEFSVKPIAAISTDVDDFSCGLHFQQENSQPHFIYVNPGIPLLPPQVKKIDTYLTETPLKQLFMPLVLGVYIPALTLAGCEVFHDEFS